MNLRLLTLFGLFISCSIFAATPGPGADIVVIVRHAPNLSGGGKVEGSVQQLLGENVALNGGAIITLDLLVPGTPTIKIDGQPSFGGTITGAGSAQPTNFQFNIGGNSSLRYLVNRSNPVTLASVPAPPAAPGTRDVSISQSGQSPGAFSTLRNLSLSGQAGSVSVPAGTYGQFSASGQSAAFVLGAANTTSVYNLVSFSLNGGAKLNVLGTVVINLSQGFSLSGQTLAGTSGHPEQLTINSSAGGVTVDGQSNLYGSVNVPAGTASLTGQSSISGSIQCNNLTVNGNATLHGVNIAPTNLAPVASAGSNQTIALPASASLSGSATDDGNPNPPGALTYLWSKISGPGTVSFGNAALAATTASFSTSGTYVLQLTASDSLLIGSASVAITVQPANQAPVVNAGSGQTIQLPAVASLTGTATDDGYPNPPATLTYSWSKVSGPGSVTFGNASQASTTAAFSIAGSYVLKLTASDSALTGNANVTINVQPAKPSIATAAAASPVTVSGSTTNLSVLGADSAGEAALTYVWSYSGPSGASFSANNSNSAKNSTATFTQAGTYTFVATITNANNQSVTSTVVVTVNQTLSAIAVAPQNAGINVFKTQQFTSSATDQFGNLLAIQPAITWSLEGSTATINATGLVTAGPVFGGSFFVTATSGAISGNSQVSITDDTPQIVTVAAANPATVSGNSTSLTVSASDNEGEPTLKYLWQVTATPAGVQPESVAFTPNGTNAASHSSATFQHAGTYTLQVTVSDSNNLGATSSVQVAVNQTETSVAIAPASAALNLNGSRQFSAVAKDQFGDGMNTQPGFDFTSTGGTISATGLYTAGTTPGTFAATVTTHDAAGRTASAQIAITNAAPVLASVAASSYGVAGTTVDLSASATDDWPASLAYTWSSTGPAAVTFSTNGTNSAKNTTVTFAKSGSYMFSVVVSDGNTSVSGNLTQPVVVSQTLSAISATPASINLNLNSTAAFSASATDQFGLAMVPQPAFTWQADAGSITGSGFFTASAVSGLAHITTTAGAVSGSATANVTDAPPTVAAAAAANPTIVAGTLTNLSVLGADDGTEPNLSYAWSYTGPTGVVFSANNSNAAKIAIATFTQSGAYVFTATITDASNQKVSSTIHVTVNQTFTVAVTPAPAALNLNGTQQFSATVSDQFGVLNPQPSLVWTATGVGNVNTTGLFSAAATAGSATVTATADGASGSATVTITDAPPTVATAAAANPATVAGTSTNLSVLGADDGGATALSYTWSSTGPATVAFSANGSSAARNTTATFTKAGSYSFTATVRDGANHTVMSSVNVVVNQTASLTLTPHLATLNLNATQQFSASAADQFGAAMPVSWSATGGTISQTGLYTAGAATGSFVVTATSGGVSDSATVTISANASPVIVAAASATPNPVTGTSTVLSALADDEGGEANLTYTWALTQGAAITFNAPNGINSSKSMPVLFNQTGSYKFTVTARDADGNTIASSVDVAVNTTPTIDGPSDTTLNITASEQFPARLNDQFGRPILPQPTFDWTATGGTIGSDGYYVAGNATGSFTVTATTHDAAHLSRTVVVTLVNNGGPIVTFHAQASSNPVTSVFTQLFAQGYSLAGDVSYYWFVSPSSGVSFNDVNGDIYSSSIPVTFSRVGTYRFTVILSDPDGNNISSSVDVVVSSVIESIALSPANPAVLPGSTVQFSAIGTDQFFNTAILPNASWSATNGSITGNGLFTAGASGFASASATYNDVTGSATVTIIGNNPPQIVSGPSASSNPIASTSVNLSVFAVDSYGLPLTYTWTGSGPAPVTFDANNGGAFGRFVTATFSQTGAYTFHVLVRDSVGLQTTSIPLTVTVVSPATYLIVSPASATIGINSSVKFRCEAGSIPQRDTGSPRAEYHINCSSLCIGDGNGRFW